MCVYALKDISFIAINEISENKAIYQTKLYTDRHNTDKRESSEHGQLCCIICNSNIVTSVKDKLVKHLYYLLHQII
jgi:hypothetical protein